MVRRECRGFREVAPNRADQSTESAYPRLGGLVKGPGRRKARPVFFVNKVYICVKPAYYKVNVDYIYCMEAANIGPKREDHTMPTEITINEKCSGSFTDGIETLTVIAIAARHYIVLRHRDCESAHVTGEDAAKMDATLDKLIAAASENGVLTKAEEIGGLFSIYLNEKCIKEGLKHDWIGVGLIDTGRRPFGPKAIA